MSAVILLVDDFPDIVEVYTLALSEKGYEVLTASNGQEGEELLGRNPQVSLVVCDVNMPVKNGFQFLNSIRSKKNNVPFVFITGHAESFSNEIEVLTNDSTIQFLEKPFKVGALMEKITNAVGPLSE